MQPTVVSKVEELSQGQVLDTVSVDVMQPTVVRTTSNSTVFKSETARIHAALQEALQLLGAFDSERRNLHVA